MGLPQSPSAERNKEPILAVLRQILPPCGTVLEIASGTGQHVVHFAAAMPALTWQPSDADASQRHLIASRLAGSGVSNVLEPLALDVHDELWASGSVGGPYDALVCINMIHIAPWSATQALFRGARRTLRDSAPLLIYGPFRQGSRHTAPSNEAFDRSLRTQNAEWGVRDLDEVTEVARGAGFIRENSIAMPANNLSVLFRQVK
jgi:cyclopropane fatty-acyl-phospholipid synthase-like methyltransferase